MRFLFLFSLLGFLLSSSLSYAASELNSRLDELTQQITQKVGEKNKKKIAVVEFSDLNGKITNFGKYLSEALITRLVNSGKFDDVVERKLLAKIINEHKLSLTDIVDPSSAKQLGKILGVDAIVTGTITDLGSDLEVNARLIGTEKGSIFAATSINITKDDSVKRLLSNSGSDDTEVTSPYFPSPEKNEMKDNSQFQGQTPQEAYNLAYNDFVKGNYDLALLGFENFTQKFSSSLLAPNAYYWLGESYYAKKEYSKAIENFDKVARVYPKHDKVASSVLKEGYAYIEMGEKSRGYAYLKKVIEQFPRSNEAFLAKDKLGTIK